MTLEQQVERLISVLDETADEHERVGEAHWAKWLRKDAAWLRRGDLYGTVHLLSAFGGMGSINDSRVAHSETYKLAWDIHREAQRLQLL